MEKQFVPYEPSLGLKELGFDEECLSTYNNKTKELIGQYFTNKNHNKSNHISAPLWQQAFSFLRSKIDLDNYGLQLTLTEKEWLLTDNQYYWSNENALNKLIEIVKSKL